MKPEAQLSMSVYQHLTLVWKPRCVFFTVPNGMQSANVRHIVNMKRQGLTPGVADWIFLWAGGCGAIELKVGKNYPTESQLRFERWCQCQGVPYEVAFTVEDVEAALKKWGRL